MPVEIKTSYEGNLRVINIHSPSGSILETDAPVDNCGKGERFSPTDLLVTSLASCVITTMGIVAQKENIDLSGLSCRAEKHMSEDKPRRVYKIVMEFTLPKNLTEDQETRLKSIATNCPVYHSLAAEIIKEVKFTLL